MTNSSLHSSVQLNNSTKITNHLNRRSNQFLTDFLNVFKRQTTLLAYNLKNSQEKYLLISYKLFLLRKGKNPFLDLCFKVLNNFHILINIFFKKNASRLLQFHTLRNFFISYFVPRCNCSKLKSREL